MSRLGFMFFVVQDAIRIYSIYCAVSNEFEVRGNTEAW